MIDVTRTETHETVHEGRLTGEQFKTLILNAIRREISPSLPHNGVDLELTLGNMLMPTAWPDVHFCATVDELWWRRPVDNETD